MRLHLSSKNLILILASLCILGFSIKSTTAQTSPSTLYVPLIGISSVPDPLALPKGPGNATYHYAVKNFLKEYPLANIQVTDDKCSSAQFIEGDDNGDGKLDYSETWRYTCTTKLSETTQSIATAIGTANGLPAAHKAYATVVVGSATSAPLVNIINITKVAYPLTLPSQGGDITFTYRVNNPGVVPLSDVSVTDDKCSDMSGKLGDTNGNNLLDITEVWTYTCTTHLTQTTTNTVSVEASANGLKAVGYATITVTVATPIATSSPSLPNTGTGTNFNTMIWGILSIILVVLALVSFVVTRKRNSDKTISKPETLLKSILILVIIVGGVGAGFGYYFLVAHQTSPENVAIAQPDSLFGWKYPVVKFPKTGPNDVAYSDIRDPGGIPEGLPVRLQIPVIGVDSAIEDALITPDGRMDVPSGSVDVAWFALGPHPGQEGSAVIGGHFGIRNGVPFVFYKLDTLKVGDKVYIVDDRGDTLAFVVRSIKLFDRNADATTVFSSNDDLAHLNLITCEGIWNQVNGSYPQRRVVFTDAIPAEGSVIIQPTPFPVVKSVSLSVGSKGVDVIALQTALEQKGFLTMPHGVARGTFGTLTRTAVSKYQTSVDLPATGIFDATTKSKLFVGPTATSPALPSTALTPPEASPTPSITPSPIASPTSSPQIFIQTAESLFSTPLNAVITILLVLAIIFVAFRLSGPSL